MLRRYCVVDGLGLELLHRRSGKTGIVLIHGNSSCKEVFSKQLRELSKTHLGIVVPDCRDMERRLTRQVRPQRIAFLVTRRSSAVS